MNTISRHAIVPSAVALLRAFTASPFAGCFMPALSLAISASPLAIRSCAFFQNLLLGSAVTSRRIGPDVRAVSCLPGN
ncbi:hypothetical protein ACIRFH_13910 [Streptomyces sp. NPDC093586]|uniref:hypothetical protein n=1 Tax=Streptomyces sp. NPDC093586 TaxID=3366042 RepID=UPI0037F6C6DF